MTTIPNYRVFPARDPLTHSSSPAGLFALTGRILLTAIFLLSTPNHFNGQGVAYAAQAGVPWPQVLVPIAGILALAGGLSILLGWYARVGGWLLVLFLIPVTLMMHNFWAVSDAGMRQMQMINFMKNLSMLGGVLMITYFGAGPFSIDSWMGKREAH